MNMFFDLHCHALPGVDDGAKDTETALKMLETAYNDGIRHVCLTPHCNPYSNCRNQLNIHEKYEEFLSAVASAGIQIELSLGSEIMYYNDFYRDIENGTCCTMCNSKYVLLEFNEGTEFSEICESAGHAASLGFVPIIAHPERYSCIEKDPSLLDVFNNEVFLIQFNSGLFGSSKGKNIKTKLARIRIRKYIYTHHPNCIVATDAHDLTKRKPLLSEAYNTVFKKCGRDYAHRIFFDTPASIFYGN